MPDQGDINSILDAITPRERSVELCLRGDLVAQLATLVQEYADALARDREANEDSLGSGQDTAGPIKRQVEALRDEAAKYTRTFKVQSIGADWRRIGREHPPEGDDFAENYRWNMTTFPAVAIAASVVSPVMTKDQAQVLIEKLADGQFEVLWKAVLAANMGEDILPKRVSGTDSTESSGAMSSTAPPEASA